VLTAHFSGKPLGPSRSWGPDAWRCRLLDESTYVAQLMDLGSAAGPTGPSADFILAIARGLPAFLLSLVDTGIFYSVRLQTDPQPTVCNTWRGLTGVAHTTLVQDEHADVVCSIACSYLPTAVAPTSPCCSEYQVVPLARRWCRPSLAR
jgi:hypothetical protein